MCPESKSRHRGVGSLVTSKTVGLRIVDSSNSCMRPLNVANGAASSRTLFSGSETGGILLVAL